MNNFKKVLSVFIIIFFIGVLYTAYRHSLQNKTTAYINTIPIAPVTAADHIRGNKTAKVTIVEYSDFECPECIYFQPTIKQIMQTYGTSIRWIVRFYPLPQHSNAEKEAEAAECVNQLGGSDRFWHFSDAIFSNTHITQDGTGLSADKLPILAKQAGVDQNKFTQCLQSGKFSSLIQHTIANANGAGIQQFPSTVIIDSRGNMQQVVGNQPFAIYKSMLDQALSYDP